MSSRRSDLLARNDLKIAVRGGGHSWVGFPLRDGSLLIDLGRLKRARINPEARRATIQPAINGRDLNRQLAEHGLAFPVGHCPSVPMSGFLLNGGLGWNSNAWGPACFSVEAARVVTAGGTCSLRTRIKAIGSALGNPRWRPGISSQS